LCAPHGKYPSPTPLAFSQCGIIMCLGLTMSKTVYAPTPSHSFTHFAAQWRPSTLPLRFYPHSPISMCLGLHIPCRLFLGVSLNTIFIGSPHTHSLVWRQTEWGIKSRATRDSGLRTQNNPTELNRDRRQPTQLFTADISMKLSCYRYAFSHRVLYP